MANVNEKGYVERKSQGARGQNRSKKETILRDWWLVKEGTALSLKRLYIPARYKGKRIKIKIEVVKNEK